MRLLANSSSNSEPRSIDSIQEVRTLGIVITLHSSPARSFDCNLHIFHITMPPSHPLSATVLFVASNTPFAPFPILPTKSFSFMYVHSRHRGSSHDGVLQGTADRTVPYKYASKIQTLVPQANLVTIIDAGHDITVTHANEVNAALLRFLSGGLSSSTNGRPS